MNRLQKMRRMIKDSKNHSILYQLQNKQDSSQASLEELGQGDKKLSLSTISPVSIFNLYSSLQQSSSSLKSSEKYSADSNMSDNRLVPKLKKAQKYVPSLTFRQRRSLYNQTTKNDASLIAKPLKRSVRINEPSLKKDQKSLKTKGSDEDCSSIQHPKVSSEMATIERPKRMSFHKKVVSRSAIKVCSTIAPRRQLSPKREGKISGWEFYEEPELDWL